MAVTCPKCQSDQTQAGLSTHQCLECGTLFVESEGTLVPSGPTAEVVEAIQGSGNVMSLVAPVAVAAKKAKKGVADEVDA